MRILSLFAIVLFLVTLAPAQTPVSLQAITNPKQITSKPNANVEQFQQNLSIEKLYMTRQVGGASWSPDGKNVVFVTNISGRNNLWTVPSGGGWPTQLTVSDQRQAAPAWSPDGKWIAYMSDYDGDEQWDIFIVSPKTGQVVNLTHTREISEEYPRWSHDGRYLAYTVKPKTSSVYEIDVFDMLMRTVKHVTTGTPADKLNFDPIWSHDGNFIAYTQLQAKGTDSNIFIADVNSGESTLPTPHDGERLYQAEDISPDGKKLLISSNAVNGYENVGLLDIASKKLSWLTKEKWETHGANFSPDGKSVTWTTNLDGEVEISLHSLGTGVSKKLPLPAGVNFTAGDPAFSRDGSRLLYSHNGARSPNDLWVYHLGSGKSEQITHSLVAGVNSDAMVEPFLVHFPSRDGKWTISAFVYVPYNMVRNGQNAAMVYVHGGPASQSMNSFNRFVQHMVNQGYMVIAPNYRGSTGYGKDFQQANLFDMGGGDLQDVLGAADFMKANRISRPQENRADGGQLRRLSDHDGRNQSPGRLGRGRADCAVRELVDRNSERRSGIAAVGSCDHGRSGEKKELFHDRSRQFSLSIRSRRRCYCWRADMTRIVRARSHSRWRMTSRSVAGRSIIRFTKTKDTALQKSRTRSTRIKRASSF